MEEQQRALVGRELRRRAQGRHSDALGDGLSSLDPELGAIADEFIFGRIWARSGLSFDDRMLVAIVALAASGNTTQLRNYLHGALQDGMDAERLHEALTMLVVYVGFPPALSALGVLKECREAHERWVAKNPTSST